MQWKCFRPQAVLTRLPFCIAEQPLETCTNPSVASSNLVATGAEIWGGWDMSSTVRRNRFMAWVSTLVMAVLGASLVPAAHAQASTLPPPEKVPTFLGIDLPLRPGERLVPIGNEECSFVVFAPKPEQFEEYRKAYEKSSWLGACRFGLAHGQGFFQSEASNTIVEVQALYGTRLTPAVKLTNAGQYDYFVSGPAFNDLSTKTLIAYGVDGSYSKASRLPQLEEYWLWPGYLQYLAYDEAGNIRKISISSPDLSYLCFPDVPAEYMAEYKAFEGEIKKTCRRKNADKHIMVRREGLASNSSFTPPVVWMKTCPLYSKYTDETVCGDVLREAIGKDYAAFAAIEAGSPAARAAATNEIFARFAPLEQAVETRLRNAGGGGQ